MIAMEAQAEFLRGLRASPPRRAGGLPLHWQCAEALRRVIEEVRYPAAVPLPPERDLALALGVSRPTLRHAMSRLANDGVIHTQHGIGTFALHGGIVRPAGMSSLYLDLKAAGRVPGTRVLLHEWVAADAQTSAALGVAVGTRMLHLERVRSADGRPIVLTRSWLALPEGAAITREQLESDGLYNLLHQVAGIELVRGTQSLAARMAEPREAELLEVQLPAAVMVAWRHSFDALGRGIERTEIIYPQGTEFLVADLRGTSTSHAPNPAQSTR